MRLGQFADLKRAWSERRGGVFEEEEGGEGGGDTPRCTLASRYMLYLSIIARLVKA